LHACRLLFGAEVLVSRDFLDYVQLSGLKSAFRRRALETHPDNDRKVASACDPTEFYQVREAYATLLDFLRRRDGLPADNDRPCQSSTESAPPAESGTPRSDAEQDSPFYIKIRPIVLSPLARGQAATSIDRFHQGPLPNRPLLFGHFLYYSGLTTWRTITRILLWQKQGRPRCGELGSRFGMLSSENVALILHNKSPHTLFGEAALALGLLNQGQVHALLRQQLRLQKKFGAILLEKQLVDEQELRSLLHLFRLHNQESAGEGRSGCRLR